MCWPLPQEISTMKPPHISVKMKALLYAAGYGLIFCSLIHASTHFIAPVATGKEKDMLDMMENIRNYSAGMFGRSTMDFFRLFSWGFTILSCMLGVFVILFLKAEIDNRVRIKFLTVNFFFLTLLMVLNVRYGILIPIILYGICWLLYGAGLLVQHRAPGSRT